MKISKTIAVLYMCIVTYLTIQYFALNGKNMAEPYSLILFISCILNLSMLFVYCIVPQSQKANQMVGALIVAIIFFSSLVKSFFHRALPGKELVDFAAYPAFNEQWLSIQKFLWHFVLDVIVFCMVLMLKNSYKLFGKKN